ncbi:MAG: methionine synthase [Deltaproteobacteria bacterium]|nr:methionine synthase [Candidatus Anaeroferrophillus wilburensis]MBN2888846.1 methionine synthase [Deltaproteobacteria bacterium]
MATGIGSLPHQQVSAASDLIVATLPEAPFWPQLPNLNYRENMYAQYAEQFPGMVVDAQGKRIFVDAGRDDFSSQLEVFYDLILHDRVSSFAISKEYAAGLWEVPFRLQAEQETLQLAMIKGQVTGPISFGLTVATTDKKPIIYDDTLADVLVKHLVMKTRWQEQFLQQLFPGLPVMMFFDEPYMVSFGTAFCSLGRETVVEMLETVFAAVDGLSGVHCCGNTDWSLLLQTSVDVLNFDAYEFADHLFLYREDLHRFLDRGGCLAWGIVPTSEAILKESAASLLQRFATQLEELEKAGFSRRKILEQSFITPSCGCGSLPLPWAETIFRMTGELSRHVRRTYGLQ